MGKKGKNRLQVGQKLWYIRYGWLGGTPDNLPGHEVTIESIARKWATLKECEHPRIDKITLEADGGEYSSPGRCYLSQAAYVSHAEVTRLWNGFVAQINRSRLPPGVTAEQIRQAAELVGITLLSAATSREGLRR